MWFVKSFFAILVLAALLYFASLNLGERVSIYLLDPDVPTFRSVPMTWALLVAFAAGVLVWFLASLFQVIAAKSEVAGLRRKNRQLTRELTDLRNMTVRDLDPERIGEDEDPESVDE
jgi:predicted PurR-regulated permease PerM